MLNWKFHLLPAHLLFWPQSLLGFVMPSSQHPLVISQDHHCSTWYPYFGSMSPSIRSDLLEIWLCWFRFSTTSHSRQSKSTPLMYCRIDDIFDLLEIKECHLGWRVSPFRPLSLVCTLSHILHLELFSFPSYIHHSLYLCFLSYL